MLALGKAARDLLEGALGALCPLGVCGSAQYRDREAYGKDEPGEFHDANSVANHHECRAHRTIPRIRRTTATVRWAGCSVKRGSSYRSRSSSRRWYTTKAKPSSEDAAQPAM